MVGLEITQTSKHSICYTAIFHLCAANKSVKYSKACFTDAELDMYMLSFTVG